MTPVENPSEAKLRVCAQMVEDVLRARGLDVAQARVGTPQGPAWSLRQGSAQVLVFLTPHETGDSTIQVVAPVLRAKPDAGPALLRRLLELNASALTQAAFGLRGDDVVLTTDRSTEGLDPIEIEEMVHRVASYADHYDDALAAEFGGKRLADV